MILLSEVYRDFLYLDQNRVDSIIAQLNRGYIKEMMEGKANEANINTKMAKWLEIIGFPFKLEGGYKHTSNKSVNKVFHDYSYDYALDLLEDNDKLIQVSDLFEEDNYVCEGCFILVSGEAKLLDYAELKNLSQRGDEIDLMFKTGQIRKPSSKYRRTSVFNQIHLLTDVFYPDLLQIKMTVYHDEKSIELIGSLNRSYLRENMKETLFKYGSKLNQNWKMLCQITKIPTKEELRNLIKALDEREKHRIKPTTNITSINNLMDDLVEVINSLQELMATVTYPNISVSPIAIYREI